MDFLDTFNPFDWETEDYRQNASTDPFTPVRNPDNLDSIHKQNLKFIDSEDSAVSAGVVNYDDRQRALSALKESSDRYKDLMQEREAKMMDLLLSQAENPGEAPEEPGYWDRVQYKFTGNPEHLYDSDKNRAWYADQKRFSQEQERLTREMEILHKFGGSITDDYARDVNSAAGQLDRAIGLDLNQKNAADKLAESQFRNDVFAQSAQSQIQDREARRVLEERRIAAQERNIGSQIQHRKWIENKPSTERQRSYSDRIAEDRLLNRYTQDELNNIIMNNPRAGGLFVKGVPVTEGLSAEDRFAQSAYFEEAKRLAQKRMRGEFAGPTNPSLTTTEVAPNVLFGADEEDEEESFSAYGDR